MTFEMVASPRKTREKLPRYGEEWLHACVIALLRRAPLTDAEMAEAMVEARRAKNRAYHRAYQSRRKYSDAKRAYNDLYYLRHKKRGPVFGGSPQDDGGWSI